ncbi:type II toxin-antitoxin system RelE/ParE family toxin [Candidatus Woesearchaeota archaeon]|nr:type II toxin-antitoxin system RelE/ParE family toxin [Candidatus Woesearchaeota archaeon]
MTVWKVFLSPDAQDFLKKSDNHIAERIKKGFEKLKTENQFHFLEHFEGGDYYKFRIGEYRALIDVHFQNHTLHVQVLDHRQVIYKRKL